MGYTDGILSLKDGKGISIEDARKAVGGGGCDIGRICQSKSINPANKYKPIRFMSGGVEIFHPQRLTEQDYRDQHYGYSYPSRDLNDAEDFYNVCIGHTDPSKYIWKPSEPCIELGNGWWYALPTKGFRLLDFAGPDNTSAGYDGMINGKNILNFSYGMSGTGDNAEFWFSIYNSQYSPCVPTLADLGLGSGSTYSSFGSLGIIVIPKGTTNINADARFFVADYRSTGGVSPQYVVRVKKGSAPDPDYNLVGGPDWHLFFAKNGNQYYDEYYLIPFVRTAIGGVGYLTNMIDGSRAIITGVPIPCEPIILQAPKEDAGGGGDAPSKSDYFFSVSRAYGVGRRITIEFEYGRNDSRLPQLTSVVYKLMIGNGSTYQEVMANVEFNLSFYAENVLNTAMITIPQMSVTSTYPNRYIAFSVDGTNYGTPIQITTE